MSEPRATEFGWTVAEIVTLVEPLNETEPDKSPPSEIVRAFCNIVAVDALPISGAVTAANVTDDDVETACPIDTVGVEPSPGV